jgi:kynurenine formamidase
MVFLKKDLIVENKNPTDIPDAFRAWPGHIGNWYRWPNDRGALNLITPEATMRGVRAAREGLTIPCARSIETVDPANSEDIAAKHFMIHCKVEGRTNGTDEQINFRVHGMINTHIDSLAHVGFHGYGFNGKRYSEMVNLENGASVCDITDMLGITTRGVFLDVARRRGVDGLKPGELVLPEDLTPMVDRLEPGDAAVIRTGVTLTGGKTGTLGRDGKPNPHYPIAGFHADCIELLASKDISLLASDSPSDTYPTPLGKVCGSPVHTLCLVFYGITLVHNMDLEILGHKCAEKNRDDFLFTVAALNMRHATGSPCSPVAIL